MLVKYICIVPLNFDWVIVFCLCCIVHVFCGSVVEYILYMHLIVLSKVVAADTLFRY